MNHWQGQYEISKNCIVIRQGMYNEKMNMKRWIWKSENSIRKGKNCIMKKNKIESPSNSCNIISIEFKIQEWIKAKWILDDEFNWIGFETE